MSFKVLIDEIEQEQWSEYTSSFADYSIYQTWHYQEMRAEKGGQKVSRFVVKDENNVIVAMSHIRIKDVKPLGLRIGYIQWGPLICRKDGTSQCLVEVLKLLREAYLGKRVNVLRIVPNVINNAENQGLIEKLQANGFLQTQSILPYHTMILALNHPEEVVRTGLHQSWRRMLYKAERAGVEIKEQTDEAPFKILERFYADLSRKKGFKGSVDPRLFARTQSALLQSERMSVMVGFCEDEPVTVHVTSNLGDTAIFLLSASSAKGYECRSSYLAWWRAIVSSNNKGMKKFDVGGIDFVDNPTVSRFKAGVGGEESFHIGTFESYTDSVVKNTFRMTEKIYRKLKR